MAEKETQATKDTREQMEAGGTGTATVSFTGIAGDDVEITSSTWTATGPVAVTPNPDDPTEAALFAAAPGPVTLTCVGVSDAGTCKATLEIMVVDKSAPTEGEISLSVKPPAKKAEAPKAPAKPEQKAPEHHAASHR